MDKKLLEALQAHHPKILDDMPKYANCFLYGEYGVGKTVETGMYGLAMYKKLGLKHLVLATDSGTDSFYNHPELLPSIEVVQYNGLSHLKAVGQAITEGIEGYEQFGLVTLDTVSQMQEEYLDWLLENYSFAGKSYREVATPRVPKAGLEPQEITSLPDYHLARNKMRIPIKTLVKAPVDVFFIAHLREPNFLEQQKNKIVRRPTITEAVFKLIAREVSLLGLMERNGTKRTIQFKTDKKTVSKSRIKELDNMIIDADDLAEILLTWKERE